MDTLKGTTIGLFVTCTVFFLSCERDGQTYVSDIETKDQQELIVEEVKLKNLLNTSLATLGDGEITISKVELPPDTVLQRHYHPGEEFIFVLKGSATLWQQGKPDTLLSKGAVFKVPYKQIHTAKTGNESVRVLVFRVRKKGEPERVIIEEE